jgi:integration host factor subunit alpha
MALTKADFAGHLFDELGLNKREAKDMVELFFEEIKKTLEQAEPFKNFRIWQFCTPRQSQPSG